MVKCPQFVLLVLSPRQRAFYIKEYDYKGSIAKKIFGHEAWGAWCQDKLIGGKLPVVSDSNHHENKAMGKEGETD
jgi:hypothetical protein